MTTPTEARKLAEYRGHEHPATHIRDALRDLADQVEALTAERNTFSAQYNDLIYQVSQKFKDETRHQTAKRYIASWEGRSVDAAIAKGTA